MAPLVSILMPIYNAAATLPFAIASLQAQTFTDWECIAVDDGSSDNPECIIQAANDQRFHFHRLSINRGRGYARQLTLEQARGAFITMLDADDWVYPDKLRQQVELFRSEPDLAAVSTGLAISDTSGNIIGLRRNTTLEPVVRGRIDRLGMPPFAFAPSMLNAELAKRTGFDTSLQRSQDTDFLIRALLGKSYAVLNAPLYVYREEVTLEKTVASLGYSCQMFRKHIRRHPVRSVVEIGKARAKQAIYFGAAALGCWSAMVSRRSRPPLPDEIEQYEEARSVVMNKLRSHEQVAR